MGYLVLTPFFLSFYFGFSRSAEWIFLNVYLPALLLFPGAFRGAPIIHNFGAAAIFGLAFWIRPQWKLTILDFLVGAFVASAAISELRTTSLSDTISMSIDNLSEIVLPYLCGKYLIEQSGIRVEACKRLVLLLCVIAVLSPVELLTGHNVFLLFFFELFNQWPGWGTMSRWGLTRVAGPFGGCILMGCIFICAIPLQVWLWRTGQGRLKIGSLSLHPTVVTLVLVGGCLMPLSRGPWIGLGFTLIVLAVAFARNTIMGAIVASIVFAAGLLYSINAAKQYTEVSWDTVQNEEQRNAYYRRVLLDVYHDKAVDGGLWGWGRAHRPVVEGMASIDNQYLFVQLMFGQVGLYLFCAIGAVSIWRIFKSGLSVASSATGEGTFRLGVGGILVGIAISISTVWLGLQLSPIYFLFIGWVEGIHVGHRPLVLETVSRQVQLAPRHAFAFKRVLQ